MVTYYLYRLINSLKFDKCGATNDWDKRCRDNRKEENHGPNCIITVLETMEGPNTPEFWQVVGDREWELADQFGYPRGTHYRVAREKRYKFNYTSASEAGKTGGAIRGLELKDGVQATEVWANHTEEERKARCNNISIGHKNSEKSKEALYNIQASKLIFTWETAEEIRDLYSKGGYTHRTLAKEYNCSVYAISSILTNKTYTSPNWYA